MKYAKYTIHFFQSATHPTLVEVKKEQEKEKIKSDIGILFVRMVAAACPAGLGVMVFLLCCGDADMTATCRASLTLRLESSEAGIIQL